ncbi:sodium:proton antiporter [Anaerobacillus sp. MEB173]|uniref:sodium:proton antiporter n=1 Tax=Anaerobacillus sp. MEB173 TaxID=3383345 RepID=UPI003F918795
MLSRLISLFTLVVTVTMVYRYRYRMMNLLLGTRWIRSLLISGTMQIPGLRERLMSRMVPF